MPYKFGKKSLANLAGVHPKLVSTMHDAIAMSDVDMGISCGLRTKDEQVELVKSGASKTMNSKHLPQASDGYSHAIDFFCYTDSGRLSWELPLYFKAMEHIRKAALRNKLKLRWGCAWHVADMTDSLHGNIACEALYLKYCDLRRSEGRTPFTDAPHVEVGS